MALVLLTAPKPWAVSEAAGDHLSTWEYVLIFEWWAGLFNVVALGALAAICPWWAASAIQNPKSKITTSAPRWYWPLVALAMVVLGFHSVPRLAFGFWDDEELNIRTTLWGKFKPDAKTGEARFRKFGWHEPVFGYKIGPNNHTLYSIPARVCAEIWNAVAPRRDFPIQEAPFRIPSLVFGMLGIAALGWLFRDWGLPGAGVTAAFLLAVHPWFIRFASECRGYSLFMALIPVAVVCADRAAVTGAWKWWAAFAGAQFALIYCWPGSILVVAALNALVVVRMAVVSLSVETRNAALGRWFVTTALAALLTIQLMLPLVAGARDYFKGVANQGFVSGGGWVFSTLCHLLGGGPWTRSGAPQDGYPEWLAIYVSHPWLVIAGASVAGLLVLLGTVRMLRLGFAGWMLAAITWVCPAVFFALAYWRRYLLYECYVVFMLPGFVAAAALGLTWVASALGRGRKPVTIAVSLAGAVSFFAATAWLRDALMHRPLQLIPESVIASRGTLDPTDKTSAGILTASYCIPPYLYDARMERLDSVEAFIALLRRADHEGKPLLLNIGMAWAARDYSPGMWEMTNDPILFEPAGRFRGFEPGLDRLLFRYRPGSAGNYDFSRFPPGGR